MSAIEVGTHAPTFTWPATDGKTYSLSSALEKGPMLIAFFKVSCPTCQFTFPFLERAAKHFGCIWGISQDSEIATREFAAHFKITFPILLEDTGDYPTSNAYGLTHVPSIFLVGRSGETSGEILASTVGFAKDDLLSMMSQLAALTNKPEFALFPAGQDIPKFKSG